MGSYIYKCNDPIDHNGLFMFFFMFNASIDDKKSEFEGIIEKGLSQRVSAGSGEHCIESSTTGIYLRV